MSHEDHSFVVLPGREPTHERVPKPAPVTTVTHAPACIELKDQFDSPQRLSFPTTNFTVLTIADHKGSEQIAGWVRPIKARYGAQVAIHGIADVAAVPGWLRSPVRRKFRQRQSYPVMLDWSGDTVKAFATAQDCVNVFVLDERGRILKRLRRSETGRVGEVVRHPGPGAGRK